MKIRLETFYRKFFENRFRSKIFCTRSFLTVAPDVSSNEIITLKFLVKVLTCLRSRDSEPRMKAIFIQTRLGVGAGLAEL